MYKIKINDEILFAEKGELLSDILIRNGKSAPHPCGGKGTCRKCKVLVDGREELSCQYRVNDDVSVSFFVQSEILSETGATIKDEITDNMCICLDIGTTTLALALVSLDTGNIAKVKTAPNPQRIFGADIMTRIEYCQRNGVGELNSILITEINRMITGLDMSETLDMYVSGNVTMLHTFFNEECSSIGVSPYEVQFLESKTEKGKKLGINKIKNVISLPSIHSFVGADLVAGMNYIGLPNHRKYNLLVDLGTNAEIVLYSENSALCTATAAGPCFEGANISCGMSATDGAIYKFSRKNGQLLIDTVNKKSPQGICGTGLVDIVAELLYNEIDETGHMEEAFKIYGNIVVNQADIRQFQLAKSAVYSGIITLINLEKIGFIFQHFYLEPEYTVYQNVKYIGDSNNQFKYAISVVDKDVSKVELHNDTEVIYEVLNIEKHDYNGRDLALIQNPKTTQVFIVGIKGIEKV